MKVNGHDFSELVKLSQREEGNYVGNIVGISYRFDNVVRNPEQFEEIMNQLID